MQVVPQEQPIPNRQTILDHLTHITRRWVELNEPVLLEIVHLTAGDKAEVKDVSHYRLDQIQEAVEHVLAMNGFNLNSYATVNPLAEAHRPPAGHRASKEAIAASFYHWADADDAEAAQNIKSFVGPKPTFTVVTGRNPTARPHVYWELDHPTTDFDAWTRRQRAIAATLKTDPAVVDPPRIMRIAGTVNWPKPKKRAKGYVAELTTLHILTNPTVTAEAMDRAFKRAESQSPSGISGDWIDQDTSGNSVDVYADILRRMSADGEKHTGVRDATAKLARAGVPKNMAEAIVRAHCPVWDENTQDLLDSAYTKFRPKEENPFTELTPEERDAVPAAIFKPWVKKDLSAIPSPEFVYSDFYARGYTSLTLAAPKVGKSMLGLAEALDMATGRGFLTGQPRDPLRVVYYNAEDDQNVIDARVSALLTRYGIDQSELEGRFWPTSGVDRDDFFLIRGQEGLINEALFVGLEKFILESGADVLIFDPLQDLSRSPETNEVFRLLGQRLRQLASTTKVAQGFIHHTRKVAPGMTATIDDGRGGSALRGTARFNRILNAMTEDEAAKAGVENHRHYFRIGDMESNLAPPSADVNRWFEKVSVETPSGAHVGAVVPWKWPDAFSGITPQQASQVRNAVDRMAAPPRKSIKANAWVGYVVGEVLGIDTDTAAGKARVAEMVNTWIKTDVLREQQVEDKRAGRTTTVVISGANDPLVTGGQGA